MKPFIREKQFPTTRTLDARTVSVCTPAHVSGVGEAPTGALSRRGLFKCDDKRSRIDNLMISMAVVK